MPRGDRTGPQGEGPMTGRQLGYGAGYDSPGYTKGSGRNWGRGFFGRGRGFFGRGFGFRAFGRGWAEPATMGAQPDDMLQLKSDVNALQSGFHSLLDRLDKLIARDEDKESGKKSKT